MKTAFLLGCCALAVSASPAKEILAELRKRDPIDIEKWSQDVLAAVPVVAPGTKKVLVIGDSWADVIAIGGNQSFFQKKLIGEKGCAVDSYCIAIPGSTSGTWTTKAVLATLTAAVISYQPDYVWFTLVGNDALDQMPECAKTGKSEVQCADQLLATGFPRVLKIVDTVHKAKPDARVLGLGYDAMFGGVGCSLVTHDVFPQCWNGSAPKGEETRCFNTQLIRIQQAIDWVAGNRSFVDQVSILGATQVAAGDPKASTDPDDRHINLDKMGPAKYWPDYLGCFHPGIAGGDDSGAMVIMEEFHKVYWSKHLTCSATKADYVRHSRGYVRQPASAVDIIQVVNISVEDIAAAPDAIDWSAKGATTAIKDQGQCGSCWAFSTTEGVESSVFMSTGKLPEPLSTEELVSCDKIDAGCGGGDIPTAVRYLKKAGGMASAGDYPDHSSKKGKNGKCTWNKQTVVQVTGMSYAIPTCESGNCASQDEAALAAALAKYGPLSICINSGEDQPGDWDKYTSGVLTKKCSAKANLIDHCVQLVGYDKTASTPYWKVKNSWGESWGEKGFIRLPYNQGNACCVGCEAVIISTEPNALPTITV